MMNDDTTTMAAVPNNDKSGNDNIVSNWRAACRHHGVGVCQVLGHHAPDIDTITMNHIGVQICLIFFVPLKKHERT